jgi:hypothetical protein
MSERVSTVAQKPVAEYDERLRVPLRWWTLATMFLATFLIAFLVAMPVIAAFVCAGVLVALTVALFLGYGAAKISVRDGVLHAGAASIPVTLLGDPVALDPVATRRTAGRDADTRAFLLLRPYLKHSVKVPLNDPSDPAPYWLLSTRKPDRLASALTAAIAGTTPAT